MKSEDYRKDQEKLGRRMGSVNGGGSSGSQQAQKRPFVAKGHDAILKDAQDAKGLLRIVTMSDGAEHVGKMVARDKFTITIEVTNPDNLPATVRRTFYKHAIESFERV